MIYQHQISNANRSNHNRKIINLPKLRNKTQESSRLFDSIDCDSPKIRKNRVHTECIQSNKAKLNHWKNNSEFSNQSAESNRLISKFIQKQIQKRLNFQQNKYNEFQHYLQEQYQDSGQNRNSSKMQTIQRNRRSQHMYGYQKSKINAIPNHEDNVRKRQKLKFKYFLKNHNCKNIMQYKHYFPEQRKANIDDYFDLSCLNKINKASIKQKAN